MTGKTNDRFSIIELLRIFVISEVLFGHPILFYTMFHIICSLTE